MANENPTADPLSKPSLPPQGSVPAPSEEHKTVALADIEADWHNNLSRLPMEGDDMDGYIARIKATPEWVSLRKSIKEKGLTTALLVLPPGKHPDGKYRLIAGYRRHLALTDLGATTVPVVVKDVDSMTADALNVVENLERSNPDTFQLATALTVYYKRYKLKSEEAARHFGKTPGYARALVMCREKLAPDILRAWSRRGELDKDGETWMYPAERKATSTPNLQTLASLPGGHPAQLAQFKVLTLTSQGKSEAEAKALVEAEGGYSFKAEEGENPAGASARGANNKNPKIALSEIKAAKEAVGSLDTEGDSNAEAIISGAVAMARFLMGEVKTVRVGKWVIYNPESKPEGDK